MTDRRGWLVALVAAVNVLAWGLLVPPFHVPDEPGHAYYAQYLAETGELPEHRGGSDWFSPDITATLADTGFYYVILQPSMRPPWVSPVERRGLDRVGGGDASTSSSNPPLYYVAQAAVYRATGGLGVLDRLAAMRVLSALIAGLTVLCVYAFLRELLPGDPTAWTVGALLAGLMPQFAFIASGVTNDGGLILLAAALLLALVRLLRRGLTVRRALAVGALLGAGVLVKTQMLAFAPAALLALVLAARRAERALPALGAAAGAVTAPLLAYGVLGATVWQRPVLDRVGLATADVPGTSRWSGSLAEQLSYMWQEYLPRLPFMTDLVPGVQPWSLWFRGLVGRFGWLDYGYPQWAYLLALAIVVAVSVLAGTELYRRRAGWRSRAGELAVLVVAAGGFALAVAAVSYRAVASTGQPFEQARYLLPLLPVFALVPALAVRACGARWAPVAGVALVLAALGFSVFGQLLTLARYYG